MTLEIDSNLFPIPDSQYTNSGSLEPLAAMSLFALNLQLVHAPGNLTKNVAGHYFFRGSAIPRPRPCTYVAWSRLCRLGHSRTRSFIVPFLPSLREDDEVGAAIGERGSRIISLSRRSQLHVRDSEGRITWGQVYIGTLDPEATLESILTASLWRSNAVEALVTPRDDQSPDSGQSSLRERMEYMATHGVLGFDNSNSTIPIPKIRRLLFQVLNQNDAAAWALAYSQSHYRLQTESRAVLVDDYRSLLLGIADSKRSSASESSEIGDGGPEGKKLSASQRFGDFHF